MLEVNEDVKFIIVKRILEELKNIKQIDIFSLKDKFNINEAFLDQILDKLYELKYVSCEENSEAKLYQPTQFFFLTLEIKGLNEIIKQIYETSTLPILNNDEMELDGWEFINVTNFIIYPGKEPIYEIIINGIHKIIITQENILTQTSFRKQYFDKFGVLLSPLSGSQWSERITEWRQINPEIKFEFNEEGDEETEIKEEILNYIGGCTPVKTLELLQKGFIYLQSNSIYIPNDHIKMLLNSKKSKITMTKLSHIMKSYLTGSSKPIRVGTKLIRFWYFNNSYFNFKEEDIIDLKETEKDDI